MAGTRSAPMDDEHLDTLVRSLVAAAPRRRLFTSMARIVSAGGCAALAGSVSARKKRKRKHKRKRRANDTAPLTCPTGQVACDGQCRSPEGATCNSHAECCSNHCVFGECYPTCLGKSCSGNADCCAEAICFVTIPYCGGCVGPGSACGPGLPCCNSACNNGFCQSQVGEPCASRLDCEAHQPCVGGTCSCPYECCVDPDCLPAERCQGGNCVPING
jgi:hypothetical protein